MSLDFINEVYLSKEMCTATRINLEHVENLLFSCLRNLRSVEIYTLLCCVTLQLLQRLLIATPFICDGLATFKTAHRDNHCC